MHHDSRNMLRGGKSLKGNGPPDVEIERAALLTLSR
jgi:hypothetical protein